MVFGKNKVVGEGWQDTLNASNHLLRCSTHMACGREWKLHWMSVCASQGYLVSRYSWRKCSQIWSWFQEWKAWRGTRLVPTRLVPLSEYLCSTGPLRTTKRQFALNKASVDTSLATSRCMGAVLWGARGTCHPHFFRWGGYNMTCLPHFFFSGFVFGEVPKIIVTFATFCVKCFSCYSRCYT